MDDRELVAAFEDCTLTGFDHRGHVRLAWIYLRSYPDPFARFIASLQRYATSLGAATKYDERITMTLLRIIEERVHGSAAETFDAFLGENQDLLEWRALMK